jgi:DNA ligase-1
MILERPLLAAKTTDADLQRAKYPMLASPKIDGIRALAAGCLLSRSLKPIPNAHTQGLFSKPEFHGFDGELVVGNPTDKNLMQQTNSGVMSRGGKPAVKYYVFDLWEMNAPFAARYDAMCNLVTAGQDYFKMQELQIVPHERVSSYEELLTLEAAYLEAGYEGVMLRSLNGRYKQNRSTVREGILLKVKRFVDSEATVLDYEPLYRNENAATVDERGYTKRSTHQDNKIADDLLGALYVQDLHSGVKFSIGSGLTLSQRQRLWADRSSLVGRIIKYKSFPVGVKDKPRIPIFLGFRSPLDL